MNVECIQMVTNFLADEIQGVNAQLLLIPSGNLVPSMSVILDATRDRQVATGYYADERNSEIVGIGGYPFPQLAVTFHDTTTLDPISFTGAKRDGVVHIAIRYINKSTNTDSDVIDMNITMRAIQRVLKLFMLGGNTSYRTMDAVGIFGIQSLEITPMYALVGQSLLAATMMVAFHVRDETP